MRDLKRDLEICAAATRGPWDIEEGIYVVQCLDLSCRTTELICQCAEGDDAEFIAEARTAWPETIRRCMAAEAEVKRLREALEHIARPIEYMHKKADKEGKRLDCGIVFRLAESASYLSGIAQDALEGDS